jgi:ArsR family transcriptional regulator
MILSVFSALAEYTHLAAIRMLHDGSEQCVCDLMSRLDASQSRMSRHMQVVKQAALVVDRRDTQGVRYRLNPDLPENIRLLIDAPLSEEIAT